MAACLDALHAVIDTLATSRPSLISVQTKQGEAYRVIINLSAIQADPVPSAIPRGQRIEIEPKPLQTVPKESNRITHHAIVGWGVGGVVGVGEHL